MNADRSDGLIRRAIVVGSLADRAVASSALLPQGDRVARPDYFIEHPPLQPKRAIAEYVASEGAAPTPRMYDSLAIAQARLSRGEGFYMRNESPDQYAGPSGLTESLRVTPGSLAKARNLCNRQGTEIDWTGLEPRNFSAQTYFTILGQIEGQIGRLTQREIEALMTRLNFRSLSEYAQLTGQDSDQYLDQISFSYWEYIPGDNMSVVADSAIPNRHHFSIVEASGRPTYLTIEKGQVVYASPSKVKNLADLLPKAMGGIETYERIRALPKFDPRRCPTMELQSRPDDPDNPVFLQTHYGRKFTPVEFRITRPPRRGEVTALFSRGATDTPQGEIINVLFDFTNIDATVLNVEGECDSRYDEPYTQTVVDRRKLEIVSIDPINIAFHRRNSLLSKPQMSVFIGNDGYDKVGPTDQEINDARNAGIPLIIPLHVTGDGNTTYIERV